MIPTGELTIGGLLAGAASIAPPAHTRRPVADGWITLAWLIDESPG